MGSLLGAMGHLMPQGQRLMGAAGVVLFAVTLLCSASGWALESNRVHIGVLYPLSGPDAERGADAWEGVRLAVVEANLAGGVHGREMVALAGDTRGEAETAVSEARRLFQTAHLAALIGVLDAGAALRVSQYSKEHHLVFLGAGHYQDRLLLDRYQPYYFHTSPSVYQMAAAAGRCAARLPWRTYAACGLDVKRSRKALDVFWSVLSSLKSGVRRKGAWWSPPGDADYTSIIKAVGNSRAEALVCFYTGDRLKEFIRQAVLLGLVPGVHLLCPLDGGGYGLLKKMSAYLPEGVLLAAHSHLNWPDTPTHRAFLYKFKARTGRYPSQWAADGYAAARVLIAALKRCRWPLSAKEIVAKLEEARVSLPWDPPGFTAHMRAKEHQMVTALALGWSVSGSPYPPARRSLDRWCAPRPETIQRDPWAIFEGRVFRVD